MVRSMGGVWPYRRNKEIEVLVEQSQKTYRGRPYDHARFERRRNVLRWMIDNIGFRFLAKVDRVEGLENFPMSGPAIVMINHIAFIDPIVVLGNLPRNIVPLSKVEAYRYPIWGIFPWLWHVIPVHRDTVDRRALRMALEVLGTGEVILVAPEGTRNPCLQRAREGVAYLGSRSGAPVVPVAVEGTSGFPTFSRERWRKPGAVVRIGRPFCFRSTGHRARREELRVMTDEAMFVLASMLSEERRGHYADTSMATTETIEFP
jgi:1-acyl-sn-glycerol-3-phosphate acyltransferase